MGRLSHAIQDNRSGAVGPADFLRNIRNTRFKGSDAFVRALFDDKDLRVGVVFEDLSHFFDLFGCGLITRHEG